MDFIQIYRKYFDLSITINIKRKYLLYRIQSIRAEHDDPYHDRINDELWHPSNVQFLMEVLKRLEPITFMPGDTIFGQNQEVEEIVFPVNFEVLVGFNYHNHLQTLR